MDYAAGWDQALNDSAAASLFDLLSTATIVLGGGIVVFGAMQLAFAYRSDDAEGKSKGLRNVIAGVIVAAVGVAMGAFLG
jgi:hypothetical protein